MLSRLRPSRHLARLLLEGLLVLAFLIQPVFVAAGELHALSHGPEAAHVHDTGTPADDSTDTPADSDPNAPEEAPHLLLHFAHCCGHAPTALLDSPPQVDAAQHAPILRAAEPALPLQYRLQDTLRPPIAA